MDTYLLMKRASDPGSVNDKDLTAAMHQWCLTVDKIASVKHRWLRGATSLFLLSSFLTLVMLLYRVLR